MFNPINARCVGRSPSPSPPATEKVPDRLAQQNVLLEQNSYLELQRNLAFDVSNQWLETGFKTKLTFICRRNIIRQPGKDQ